MDKGGMWAWVLPWSWWPRGRQYWPFPWCPPCWSQCNQHPCISKGSEVNIGGRCHCHRFSYGSLVSAVHPAVSTSHSANIPFRPSSQSHARAAVLRLCVELSLPAALTIPGITSLLSGHLISKPTFPILKWNTPWILLMSKSKKNKQTNKTIVPSQTYLLLRVKLVCKLLVFFILLQVAFNRPT